MGKNSSCSMRIAPPNPHGVEGFDASHGKRHEGEKVRSWMPLVLVSRLGEVGTNWTFRHSPPKSPGADVCDWLCEVFRRVAHPHHPGTICQFFHRVLHRTRNRTGCYGAEWSWTRSLGACTPYHSANWFGEPQSPRCLPPQVCCMIWGKEPQCISKGGWTGCRRL
jgi:hypothetical protein